MGLVAVPAVDALGEDRGGLVDLLDGDPLFGGVREGQEVLVTRHPTTGAPLELRLIDCDAIEVVR